MLLIKILLEYENVNVWFSDERHNGNSHTIKNRIQKTGGWGLGVHERTECTSQSARTSAAMVHIHLGTTTHTW